MLSTKIYTSIQLSDLHWDLSNPGQMLPCWLKTIPRAARISGQHHVVLTDAELAAEQIT